MIRILCVVAILCLMAACARKFEERSVTIIRCPNQPDLEVNGIVYNYPKDCLVFSKH